MGGQEALVAASECSLVEFLGGAAEVRGVKAVCRGVREAVSCKVRAVVRTAARIAMAGIFRKGE